MPLYLKIVSPKVWAYGDYTNSASYDLEMKIYSDPQLTSTVDLTTFTTLTLLFKDPNNGYDLYSTTTGLTSDSSGNLYWRPTQSTVYSGYGHVKVCLTCENSTTRMTAVGTLDSNDLLIRRK